jgi:hypothetical protein
VNYGYDNLYRLTGETIASDPNGINDAVNYIYDPVGNRKQMTSTLAPVPAGLWNYDANDRFKAGDTYDSTASSGSIAKVYDFSCELSQPILAEVRVHDRSEPILVRRPESPSLVRLASQKGDLQSAGCGEWNRQNRRRDCSPSLTRD